MPPPASPKCFATAAAPDGPVAGTQHFGNARGGNLALTTEILLGYCSHAIFPQFHITLLNCVYAFEGINKQNLVELKTILQTYSHERT